MPCLRCLPLFAACLVPLICLPVVAQVAPPSSSEDAPPVLRISSREVVVDIVARDRHNDPVADLTQADFQVFELGEHQQIATQHIRSLRVVDPRRDASRAGSTDSGFRISSGAVCALNSTIHYEISIEASSVPGFHQLLVNTTRPKINVSFRHRYFVGATAEDVQANNRKIATDGASLREAACFHSLTPSTLAITAHPLASSGAGSTRYSVIVRPESLTGIGLDGTNTRVQLDFGMCTFDATGAMVQFLHSSVDHQLKPDDLDRVQSRGLVNQLAIPGDPPPLARFVVRDRETGNLGTVDVAQPVSLSSQSQAASALPRPAGSIIAFGVVTPRESAFCGDVYELNHGTSALPDYWSLDPVGSVYTDKLFVPDQDITVAGGIPGVTRNNTWFGVDYFGEFFLNKPGEYEFELQSDDGSRLEIDNQTIIDLDGVHSAVAKTSKYMVPGIKKGHVRLKAGLHTIHVPYFQGPPTSLALVLSIKPPGESMRPFNITEYTQPVATQ
jgi:hypothetical protein